MQCPEQPCRVQDESSASWRDGAVIEYPWPSDLKYPYLGKAQKTTSCSSDRQDKERVLGVREDKVLFTCPLLSIGDDSLELCKVVKARRTFILVDVDFAADGFTNILFSKLEICTGKA